MWPPPLVLTSFSTVQESTLKSVLSALWNLSAHSTENKAAICQVDGALGFLVSTLTYRCQGNSLAVIESGGGILRNVSSLVATREDYRSAFAGICPAVPRAGAGQGRDGSSCLPSSKRFSQMSHTPSWGSIAVKDTAGGFI